MAQELKVASVFEFEKILRGKSNKLFSPKSEVDAVLAEKDKEIENLKKKLVEYEDCAYNACAERDDNQAAIDELTAENAAYEKKVKALSEKDAAIAELKEFAKDACLERDDNQNVINELEAENRRLKRALYKACANWADVVAFENTEGIGYDNSAAERWRKMESKCLKKAEENK